jgi:phosphatidylglycerol:prolipoprotein diacylglycerol transferase
MAYPYLSDLVRELTGLNLPLPLPMFGLLVATAFVAVTLIFQAELKRLHAAGLLGPARQRGRDSTGRPVDVPVPPEDLASNLSLTVLFAGFVGARIFSFFEYPHEFLADPVGAIFSRTGFTYYGGLVLGLVAGILYARWKRIALLPGLDAVAPAIAIGYGIGRLGCQLSGDGDWGTQAVLAAKPAWLPLWLWAETYDHNVVGIVLPPPGVYPTPLYEFGMAVVTFAILWALRRHPFRAGWLFALYLVLSGSARFLVELIRVNPVFHLFGFTGSQAEFISAAVIAAGLAGLAITTRRRLPTATPAAVDPSRPS